MDRNRIPFRGLGSSRGRPYQVPLFALVSVFLLAVIGCSSNRSRRQPTQELREHKLAVIRENEDQLTSQDKLRILAHPGRSTEEIDLTVEEILTYNETLKRADQAGVELGARKSVRGAESSEDPSYATDGFNFSPVLTGTTVNRNN